MANIDAIPGWNSSTPVTEKGDLPSVVFINWQNTLLRAVQAAILTLNNQVAALTQQQAIFLAAQNASSTAQATAAAAQATADSGGSARSGNATSTINVGASWSAAATVNLLTVSVGDLTIEGSGPLQAGNSDIVPGGSSSGSGVVVGGGLVTFALGTDTAGSGRVPAGFNGCVGMKGTVGSISTVGGWGTRKGVG